MTRGCVAAAALGLLLGCADERVASGPERPPAPAEIALDGVHFPEQGLPDPCQVLRAAGAEALLGRPLEPEPLRFERLCMLQVDRGRRAEPQVSAALELATREQPRPESLEDYIVEYGEGPILAGSTRDALQLVPELGDFAVWFPHADGSLTLSAFRGSHFLSVEVHGVDPEIAFDWARELALRVIERLPDDAT